MNFRIIIICFSLFIFLLSCKKEDERFLRVDIDGETVRADDIELAYFQNPYILALLENNAILKMEVSNYEHPDIYTFKKLPAAITAFNAVFDNDCKCISISWSTSQEIDVASFEIQRSTDGLSFEEIEVVTANGNTNTQIDYHFEDNQLSNENHIYYYRIKINDIDGLFEYTHTESALNLNRVAIYNENSISYYGKNGWFVIDSYDDDYQLMSGRFEFEIEKDGKTVKFTNGEFKNLKYNI